MNIITPAYKWNGTLVPLKTNNVRFIVIHHIDAENASVEDIHSWHLANGWAGIGYNEYIRKDGTVYIGRGDNIGAQCGGFNSCSYGIALEGNFDKETTISEAQFKALVERCIYHKNRFPSNCCITRHSELVSTSCPGKNFPMLRLLEATSVKQVDRELINALKEVQKSLIINSPTYWENNAKEGLMCNGAYVRQLILNMANYIMVTTTKM